MIVLIKISNVQINYIHETRSKYVLRCSSRRIYDSLLEICFFEMMRSHFLHEIFHESFFFAIRCKLLIVYEFINALSNALSCCFLKMRLFFITFRNVAYIFFNRWHTYTHRCFLIFWIFLTKSLRSLHAHCKFFFEYWIIFWNARAKQLIWDFHYKWMMIWNRMSFFIFTHLIVRFQKHIFFN